MSQSITKDTADSVSVDTTFHYPPELLRLLTEAIPRLCKSKRDLLLFFQGAGIDRALLSTFESMLRSDKAKFNKFVVACEILATINEKGEKCLRQRREVLKRVTQFDDFSICWESDQATARGLVAQIRDLVNVKDSFTRINLERERERQERRDALQREADEQRRRSDQLDNIRRKFFALFSESNPYIRGKALEAVLNDYFACCGILVSEAITVKGDAGAGIVEQIDGVIQVKGNLYLVEVKWEQESLGRDKVSPALVRVFSRGLAGGIIISYSDYSPAAITDCKEALRDKVVVLCRLEEFVRAIDKDLDVNLMIETKINEAIIRKNPLFVSAT